MIFAGAGADLPLVVAFPCFFRITITSPNPRYLSRATVMDYLNPPQLPFSIDSIAPILLFDSL
jgi:hypothetical protein